MIDSSTIHIPQKIAIHTLLECVDSKNIIFVGGIADYVNLRKFINLKINDIDVVVEGIAQLAFLSGYYGVESTGNPTYPGLHREYFITDIPVGSDIVRIDLFEMDHIDVEYRVETLLNHQVKVATPSHMWSFHKQEVSRLQCDGNGCIHPHCGESLDPDRKRLLKHSRKMTFYEQNYDNLHEVDIQFRYNEE